MNIRTILNFKSPYHSINREERNLAAILYHVLLINENLSKFLSKIKISGTFDQDEIEVYFEYSFLRDIWDNIGKIGNSNDVKRELILKLLSPVNIEYLETCSIEEFNNHFGVGSTQHIESPGNWQINKFKYFFPKNNAAENTEFLKTCRFKWCFNAKPDVVIHLSNNLAVCIETKLESREGIYPTDKEEKTEFSERKLDRIGQVEIQKMILKLLGHDSVFIYIVKKTPRQKRLDPILLWKDAFDGLDLTGCPRFIKEWIIRL